MLSVDPQARDDRWLEQFYETVVDASFRCGQPQVLNGPDGYPYFVLESPTPGEPFDSYCISNVSQPLTERGIGVVINPSPNGADWAFSAGELTWFRMCGSLQPAPVPSGLVLGKEVLTSERRVLCGAPSESVLPSYTRAALRQYMREQLGVTTPMVLLISTPESPPPGDLAFSVFREQFSSDAHYQDTLNRLCWFLPRHYSVVGLPGDAPMRDAFVPL